MIKLLVFIWILCVTLLTSCTSSDDRADTTEVSVDNEVQQYVDSSVKAEEQIQIDRQIWLKTNIKPKHELLIQYESFIETREKQSVSHRDFGDGPVNTKQIRGFESKEFNDSIVASFYTYSSGHHEGNIEITDKEIHLLYDEIYPPIGLYPSATSIFKFRYVIKTTIETTGKKIVVMEKDLLISPN